MKTYADTLDDQIRAAELLRRSSFPDIRGVWQTSGLSLSGVAAAVVTGDSYFASEDLCALVSHAAANLGDARLEEDDFISPSGWLTLAVPYGLAPVSNDYVALFNAMTGWVGDTSFRLSDMAGVGWVVGGGVVLCAVVGSRSDEVPLFYTFILGEDPPETEAQLGAWLKAFWLITSQRSLSEITPTAPPRPFARRAARAGVHPSIRVIRLPRRIVDGARSEHESIDWQTRWIVSGHWRRQPWGPERKRIRSVWIAPYVKGPEDKPLKPQAHRLFVAGTGSGEIVNPSKPVAHL